MKLSINICLLAAFATTTAPDAPAQGRGITGNGFDSGGINITPKQKEKTVTTIQHVAIGSERVWKSIDPRKKPIEGSLLAFAHEKETGRVSIVQEEKVRLLVGKKTFTVPLDKLSADDQAYIHELVDSARIAGTLLEKMPAKGEGTGTEGKPSQAPAQEASARKDRSIQRLKKEGVPTIAHLPVIANSKSAKKRTKEEVAERAIALCIAAVKGEGLEQEHVDALVKKFGAEKYLSPDEAAFIAAPNPSKKERIQFSWRYECYWVLLWSLGYVEELERPTKICDVSKAVGFLTKQDKGKLIEGAKLRPLPEILDEADLIYRYHWAVTNARLKAQDPPAGLEKGVVLERHYVLNWLIGNMDQAWDDISTDT